MFDESIDVYERINSFIVKSDELLPRWRAIRNKPEGRMHYQNVNAVTTYLWLRYPDKYYIFKYGIVKTVSEKLGSDYTFKKGAHAENVRSFLKFYNEIRDELQKDVLEGINDAMSKDVTYQNMKEHPIGEVLNIDKMEE